MEPKVDALIRDAVEAATQSDDLAVEQLHKLKNGASVTDPNQALDEFQGTALQAEITMIQFSLPHGQSPEAVAAWWNSLTDAQRRELTLALPVELADLNGIPDEIKKEPRGPGSLDRVELTRYVIDHWTDESIDWPGANNCTNFASTLPLGIPVTRHGLWVGLAVAVITAAVILEAVATHLFVVARAHTTAPDVHDQFSRAVLCPGLPVACPWWPVCSRGAPAFLDSSG